MARRALLITLLVSIPCLAQTAKTLHPKNGSVSGSVVRADNLQPVKKAKISLEPNFNESSAANLSPEEAYAAYRDRVYGTETDETGHYLLSDVPPGQYHLRAEKIGFVASQASIRTGELPVTVVAGQVVNIDEVQLRPAGAIAGRVVNEDNEPMANVSVQALRYGYREGLRKLEVQAEGQTNDLGEYRIFGLLPRKYYVRASVATEESEATHNPKVPEQAYWPLFYPDAKSLTAATRLEVKAADEQRANFNLVPAPAFRVSGKVTGIPPSKSGDLGFVRAMLITKDSSDSAGGATLTATNPVYAIGPVPPGEYWLVAFSAEVQVELGGVRNAEQFRVGYVPVTVVGADVPNMVVRLEPRKTVLLPGKVRIEPAPPMAVNLKELYVALDSVDEESAMENSLAMVRAMTASGSNGQTSTDGSFKVSIAAGSGTVQPRLNARSHGFEDYYTKSVLLGGRDVTESGISPANITPGTTLELVVSPYGGRVEGTVLDSNKKPVIAAFVACVPTDPKLHSRHELFITDITNQHGRYVLRGLRPGAYKLYAFDELDPGAIYSSEFLKPFEDMGESISVHEKDTLTKPLQVLHQTED